MSKSINNNFQYFNFFEFLNFLWLNKQKIILTTITFFIVGIIYTLYLNNIYRASSIFYPHYEKVDNSNSLRSLAGLAGINIESESSNNIPSNLYPKLINSPIFKSKILNEKLIIKNKTINYREYLIKNYSFYSLKDIIYYPISLFKKKTYNNNLTENNLDILNFTDEEYKIHKYLEDKILINLNEQEGFIELSVDDINPIVASQIAKSAKNILQESIIDFKIKNISETFNFINNQLEIAKKNFYLLQDSLATFKDKNINIKSDIFLNQYSRIETEYNISRSIYNELAVNKEKIAIDVRKNTPIFTVIKPVIIPNEKNYPSRLSTVIFITFLGFSCSTLFLFFKVFFIDNMIKSYNRID